MLESVEAWCRPWRITDDEEEDEEGNELCDRTALVPDPDPDTDDDPPGAIRGGYGYLPNNFRSIFLNVRSLELLQKNMADWKTNWGFLHDQA